MFLIGIGSLIFQLIDLVSFFWSNLKQINYTTLKIEEKIWGYINIVEICTYEKNVI